ncbi:MAG: SusD/RagB family nutrient-binding outer membrane lipoprotein [Bacteroidota bacterium]
MKQLYIYLITGIIFIASACDFSDEINVSPAIPEDVSAQSIVPAAQAGLAWVVGGELVRLSGLFTQQFIGINAQQADNYRYLFISADADGMWRRMYVSALQPLVIVREKALEDGSNHTAAMADVLIAHGLGSLTDVFGDIPYTTAFGAEEMNFQPTYDTQEEVYATIHSLLDEAIATLNGDAGNGTALGSEDLIYGGNTAAWVAAAYSLKAKYYLRTTKINSNAYSEAESALANAITSSAGDFQLSFGNNPNEPNPAYQFSQDRAGNINIDPSFFNLLNNLNDPRRGALFLLDESDTPDPSGFSKTFDAGTFYTAINAPVILTSFVEMKFIEAEIELMGNADVTAAEAALAEAISASIIKLTGSDDAAYATANSALAGLTDNDARLEQIMAQKYIAMYSNGIEPWTDFRRTGFPALSPNANGVNSFNLNGEIPRRASYPQTEIDLNRVNVPIKDANLQTPVWWDDAP